MWAKSALLSALLAASAFAAPADFSVAQQGAFQPELTIQAQYRGERGGRDRGGAPQCTRPIRDAADEVRSRAGGGNMMGYECLERGGRAIYVIRWRMPDGQLRDFTVSGG